MMSEEKDKAKKIIQQTAILSAVEKAEWFQLLSDMTDKQVADLIAILTPAPPKPMFAPKPAPKEIPAHPLMDLNQKEISTSVPFYELELPEHASASKFVPPVHPSNPIPVKIESKIPAPQDPTDLQQRVESIVKELEQKKTAVEPPHVPAPVPHTLPHLPPEIIPPQLAHHEPHIVKGPPLPERREPQVRQEMKPLVLKTPEDFAKLEPKNIHAANPNVELQTILSYMAEIGKKNKIYDVINNFEKSLLYRTYLNIGIALLNDAAADRDQAYANIINILQKNNQQWLSKEEFEAFADFRKSLDQMV